MYKHSIGQGRNKAKRAVPSDDASSAKQWQYMHPLSKPIA